MDPPFDNDDLTPPKLDHVLWDRLRRQSRQIEGLPVGIQAILSSGFSAVDRLPAPGAQTRTRPVINLSTFDDSYLDFLARQIDANREYEPEWSKTLERRREAFMPYVGDTLVKMELFDGMMGASFWFTLPGYCLFHHEHYLTVAGYGQQD